jgi:hypothetical protein
MGGGGGGLNLKRAHLYSTTAYRSNKTGRENSENAISDNLTKKKIIFIKIEGFQTYKTLAHRASRPIPKLPNIEKLVLVTSK